MRRAIAASKNPDGPGCDALKARVLQAVNASFAPFLQALVDAVAQKSFGGAAVVWRNNGTKWLQNKMAEDILPPHGIPILDISMLTVRRSNHFWWCAPSIFSKEATGTAERCGPLKSTVFDSGDIEALAIQMSLNLACAHRAGRLLWRPKPRITGTG